MTHNDGEIPISLNNPEIRRGFVLLLAVRYFKGDSFNAENIVENAKEFEKFISGESQN